MSVTDKELDAIADRALGATRGPWVADHHRREDVFLGSTVRPADSMESILMLRNGTPCLSQGDAVFIAAARSDVVRLVAEVRRHNDEIRQLSRMLLALTKPADGEHCCGGVGNAWGHTPFCGNTPPFMHPDDV